MTDGAHDYLTKPLILADLKAVPERTLSQQRLEDELAALRDARSHRQQRT
jgi:DNA-binding NtrC family response regulator